MENQPTAHEPRQGRNLNNHECKTTNSDSSSKSTLGDLGVKKVPELTQINAN